MNVNPVSTNPYAFFATYCPAPLPAPPPALADTTTAASMVSPLNLLQGPRNPILTCCASRSPQMSLLPCRPSRNGKPQYQMYYAIINRQSDPTSVLAPSLPPRRQQSSSPPWRRLSSRIRLSHRPLSPWPPQPVCSCQRPLLLPSLPQLREVGKSASAKSRCNWLRRMEKGPLGLDREEA